VLLLALGPAQLQSQAAGSSHQWHLEQHMVKHKVKHMVKRMVKRISSKAGQW
jgi:hypothetical protein